MCETYIVLLHYLLKGHQPGSRDTIQDQGEEGGGGGGGGQGDQPN